MYESFEQGKAVSMDVKTVASGLSPPKAGDTRRNLHLLIHFIDHVACNIYIRYLEKIIVHFLTSISGEDMFCMIHYP